MTGDSKSRSLPRVLSAILSIPLRFKITIPYLIVAILLAGLATWLVGNSFAKTIQGRFNDQLVDGFAAASEAMFQAEGDQLTDERAVARTDGVAEAVLLRDTKALDTLIRPIAANSRIAFVHVLDAAGQPVYSLRATTDGFASGEVTQFTNWESVKRVLAGESDNLGDKFAGVIDAPWGAVLYTAGPIKKGDQLVGVALVGRPANELAAQLTGSSLANVTIFRPDGQVAATTFGQSLGVPGLADEAVTAVTAGGKGRLQNQLLRLGSHEYNEALGPLILRGQPSGWIIGLALPRSLVTEIQGLGPVEVAGWFTVAVLAVIGLGVIVAQIVAIPVFELVSASSQVAQGHLDVKVRERARDELGLLATRFNRMVVDLRQREFMRDLFGRIVSEEVREALLTGDVGLGGESKIVTVLFTDIRDFTTLSEHFTPQEVVNFLNQYFGVITQPIREVGGLVNKFGGDSTLAIFGAPVSAPPAESAWQAVRAALMIRARLAEYNARRVDLGRQLVRMGIGINTGEVITGNVGSEERFEYTVIGDTVNIASRVEGTTKEYVESQIMITEATLNALGKDVRLRLVDHGQVALKGKKTLVRIYGVFGIFPDEAEEEDWLKLDPASRRNVLEALLIYCKGYSVSTAALTKNMTASGVQHWIDLAAEHIDSASATLRREYGLTDAELDRLRPFASRRSQPVSQPVSYIESKVSVAVVGDTPSPAIRG